MTVWRAREVFRLGLNQDAPEHSCRPAVDVLFRSVARTFGPHARGRYDRNGFRWDTGLEGDTSGWWGSRRAGSGAVRRVGYARIRRECRTCR